MCCVWPFLPGLMKSTVDWKVMAYWQLSPVVFSPRMLANVWYVCIYNIFQYYMMEKRICRRCVIEVVKLCSTCYLFKSTLYLLGVIILSSLLLRGPTEVMRVFSTVCYFTIQTLILDLIRSVFNLLYKLCQ